MLRRLLSSASRPSSTSDAAERVDLAIGGEERPVLIKRSRTARRYTLRLKSTTRQLVLTMPVRASLSAAREFLKRHEGWIAARFDTLPTQIPFEPGAMVPVRGVPHRIEHRGQARGTVWLDIDDEGAPVIAVAGGIEHLARRVRDFLKRLARADLEAASRRLCDTARCVAQAHQHQGHIEPLGIMLVARRDRFFLAHRDGAPPLWPTIWPPMRWRIVSK